MQITPIEIYIKKNRPNSSFDENQKNVFEQMIYLQSITEDSSNNNAIPNKNSKYKGLYIYGDVGRGKTMMAKTYIKSSLITKKTHINFYTFLQLVREETIAKKNKKPYKMIDIINKITSNAKLILLDEFYLNDKKTDNLTLQILHTLIKNNIILIITSNIDPDKLKSTQIQNIITTHMICCLLCGAKDYRETFNAYEKTTYYLSSNTTIQKMNNIFKNITKSNQFTKDVTISRGIKITAYKYSNNVGWFFFKQLCNNTLNSVDYDLIARKYKTVFLINIPILTDKNYNDTKKFASLIDKLYEHRTKLICLADELPENLYQGQLQKVAFSRTISRLNAMQTKKYIFSKTKQDSI